MKKICFLSFLLFLLIAPITSQAQNESKEMEIPLVSVSSSSGEITDIGKEKTFKAKVIGIQSEKNIIREDGSTYTQQNLILKGLSGDFKNKEITSEGIGDFDFISVGTYKVGDTVYVDANIKENGETFFMVTDYNKTGWIYLLAAIFIALTIMVGGFKGLRSLLALILSALVIIFLIIPQIMQGSNPLIIAVLGSLLIMMIIIYLTDGFQRKSHLAVISVFTSLLATLAIAWIFTTLSRLSGFSSEEATLLIGTSVGQINFQGLLLAGIMIGAIGVLDDIILGQIEAVSEIKAANPNLSSQEVFKSATKVGKTHLGAIVNTLFLTYTGASLPLLMLFYLNPAGDLLQVINNEVIVTEIVRTLVGSIGLILSMPIATYLASKFLKSSYR